MSGFDREKDNLEGLADIPASDGGAKVSSREAQLSDTQSEDLRSGDLRSNDTQERREADLLVDAYLDRMCARVKAKELHSELREEMRGHIEELAAGREDSGASPLESASWALAQMGDADEVGGTLGQIHRPKFNWKLLVPLSAIVAIGLAVIFSIGTASWYTFYSDGEGLKSRPLSYLHLAHEQLLYILMGAAVCTALIFFDYKRLQKYSLALYVITLGLTLLTAAQGWTDGADGQAGYGYLNLAAWRIEWTTPSLYLFVLSLTGLLTRQDWRSQSPYAPSVMLLIGLLIVPVLPYIGMHKTLTAVFYLMLALPLYVKFCGRREHLRTFLPASAVLSAGIGLYLLQSHYWADWAARRIGLFQSVYAPQSVNPDVRFLNDRISEVLNASGLWGHGFGSSFAPMADIYSDMVFIYFIYSFGWIGAAVFLGILSYLIVQLLRSIRQVRDLYGKTLIVLFSSAFIVQTLYTIGASLNLLPYIDVHLPFLSYGSSSIVYFALFGLMLGIHRRRDIVPKERLSNTKNTGAKAKGVPS
ncbi:FtsW/RodA/SpoVE family cell cycle protein [Saccharibacillus kuerlensis]|uniref:Cell division protein FtsW n=1 Tax=Saccharibacillus kuerlensis TaxID=459527 RepID=A0ABQ2L2J5_9BACL|nr:FtsW/RodA/SpoVE family cell cycle protein [Saccharibacillus kuerlensis]GGO00463.1 cell division protein FtsW [Saccharibacillus kuerlensis]